ncbi:hypothetical protein P3G55_18820 [Leptospira sp. 96542]|nr:hypothetical protein [Leptospira sp. 96542]
MATFTSHGRGSEVTFYVRRLVYQLTHQDGSRRGVVELRRSWVVCSCETPGCVHPDHLVMCSPSERRKDVPKTLMHREAIARGRRAKSRISDEAVAAMRADPRTDEAVAKEHGVHRSYVSSVRADKRRRDYRNPWEGLR